jgi:hypothetical protein
MRLLKEYLVDTKILRDTFVAVLQRYKWWFALEAGAIIVIFSYPFLLRYFGVVTSPIDQINLTLETLILVVMLLPPFFNYFMQPRIVVQHFVEHSPDDSSKFRLGWKLRNEGRTPTNNVTVRARFVLHTGRLEQSADKEFIVISQENFLPPSGHQPDFQISMSYDKRENTFGLLLESKDVQDNIIERSRKWYPLPLFKEQGLGGLMYWVILALDGQNLRDKDKILKKYSLIFGEKEPTIELLTSETADFLKMLEM